VAQVLILGATGFIGSAVTARLRAAGHGIVVVARGGGAIVRRLGVERVIRADLRDMADPAQWAPHLRGIDAVLNCAGVLQDSGRDATGPVHFEVPKALYEACHQAGVRRVIHLSAMNVEAGGVSDFSRSKQRIEDWLQQSALDWVILRPSVVVGRAAFGGSALFRGLAALPFVPKVDDAGRIAVVQLDDVAETVVRMVASDAPSRVAIDLAGPEALTFEAIVARYRAWLGWRPARAVSGAGPLLALGYALGDLAGKLGWRPPVRSTARAELRRGAVRSPEAWTRLTGIAPRSLDSALAAEPASVQERWFARLFLLKPLALVIFAFFWLLTGYVSLGPGFEVGMGYMRRAEAGWLSAPSVIAGGLADIVIGLGILWRRTTRLALVGGLLLTLGYLVIGSLILPELWLDPLGPMMKVWPLVAFNLMLLAILDER
jgi:uncharacterized protein YbjT (DUF2867 family)